MDVGDTTEIAGYVFTFEGARQVQGPNYQAMQGLVTVTKNGRTVAELRPDKRVYRVQSNPMTEAAIASGLTRDLYVSMGNPIDNGGWVVRVYYKPFVSWIWGGCVLMALGGAIAASDRRYRVLRREQAARLDATGAAAT
jgi:cytochrome c-type biogenesis protein CcmF